MSDNPPLPIEVFEERVRRNLTRVMFAARWIMAPIYLGLLVALVLVMVKFIQKLVMIVPDYLALTTEQAIFFILTLVDLSLVANLVVTVMFAGWETFVGRLLAAQSDDRPNWLRALDLGTVKLKLMGSIVAIASIEILETFVHIKEVDVQNAVWQLAILLGIGVSGVMMALTDRLVAGHGEK
jgi:uncharacterized protein (TIGR00645 family)